MTFDQRVDVGPVEVTPFLVGKDAIYASDQQPGEVVTIGFALLSRDGFVVIHDDEGGPGAIMGASDLLSVGRTNGLRIILDVRLEQGYYFAMLHVDDGDRKFDPTKDKPVTSNGDSAIQMRFLITNEGDGQPAAISL